MLVGLLMLRTDFNLLHLQANTAPVTWERRLSPSSGPLVGCAVDANSADLAQNARPDSNNCPRLHH